MPDWNGLRAWSRASAGLELSDPQIDQLATYVDLLLFWNRRVALVAQSQANPDAILVTHVADSLYAAARCPDGGRVADLGSGGGLPGIPIAIARPGAAVTLIESVGKKASFLSEARRTLGCRNLSVLDERIEAASLRPDHAGSCDIATARALADLQTLRRLAAPLLAPGGRLLAMRSVAEDLSAVGDHDVESVDYALPDGSPRRLVILPRG